MVYKFSRGPSSCTKHVQDAFRAVFLFFFFKLTGTITSTHVLVCQEVSEVRECPAIVQQHSLSLSVQ